VTDGAGSNKSFQIYVHLENGDTTCVTDSQILPFQEILKLSMTRILPIHICLYCSQTVTLLTLKYCARYSQRGELQFSPVHSEQVRVDSSTHGSFYHSPILRICIQISNVARTAGLHKPRSAQLA